MQLTRRILDAKWFSSMLLRNFGSVNTRKLLPVIDQVSPIHIFHVLTTDLFLKPKINNAKTLQYDHTMQYQRLFSSKPLQNSSSKAKNVTEDEGTELICRVINQREWSDGTETELGSLGIELSTDIVLSALQTLKKTPEKALKFFLWAASQTDFRHSSGAYNAVLRILGRKSCIEQFWEIVAEMTSEGHQMDEETYMTVLTRFFRDKLLEDAVGLFVLMMDSTGNKPSSQNCCMILQHLSSSGSPDIDLVYRVVETFENGNGKFDKALYDGIHRCLTLVGNFDEAIGVMKTMEEAGFAPDNTNYSQLVFGLCKAGTLDEACKVLDVMKELGCEPNLKTWTTLIAGHCRAGEVDRALSCFVLMLESGCDAGHKVVGVLVNTLCSQNRIEDAHSFLCRMIKVQGFTPSQIMFKELVQKLTGAGKVPEALKLAELMINQDCNVVRVLVKDLCSKNRIEDAHSFLCRMIEEKGFTPSQAMLNELMQKLTSEGKVPEALKLAELMISQDCNADCNFVRILVNNLCSQNRIEDAHSFLCRMIEEKGFKPPHPVIKKLLQKLTTAGKLPEAVELSDLMISLGFRPFAKPFYKLFAQGGTVDKALGFLKTVTRNRCRPQTVKIYTSMLNAFYKVGKKAEAQELLYKSPRHIHRNPDLLFQYGSVDAPTPA